MAKRANKFNAKPVTVDGVRFDSTGEYRHWAELEIRQRAGEISELTRQIPWVIEINGIKIGKLVADYQYVENGKLVVSDFKGFETPLSKFKRKCIKAQYGIDVQIVKAK